MYIMSDLNVDLKAFKMVNILIQCVREANDHNFYYDYGIADDDDEAFSKRHAVSLS